MKRIVFVFVAFAANVLLGCTQMHEPEEDSSAEAASAFLEENSLVTNSIDLNGLFSNSIDLNGLDPQVMSPTVMLALQDPGQLGENTRLLYKYLISCALTSTNSLSFSWTDSSNVVHPEQYWGSIGLASGWRYSGTTFSLRRSVSACLAARANYYGTPVIISIRGPQNSVKSISAEEQAAYPMEEGVFWGDLFTSPPRLYACHKGTNITNSRSKLRECAAGHAQGQTITECAYITIRGDCDTLCDPVTANDPYRPRCTDPETGKTNDVISVFLPQ